MILVVVGVVVVMMCMFTVLYVTRKRDKDIEEIEGIEEDVESSSLHYSPWKPDIPQVLQMQEIPKMHPTIKMITGYAADFIRDPQRWDLLVAVADVYSRGDYPMFRPDGVTAELCYKAAAMSPDPTIAGVAQMKLLELKMSPVDKDDINSESVYMDPSIGRSMYDLAIITVQSMPWSMFKTPTFAGIKKHNVAEVQEINYDHNRDNQIMQREVQQRPQLHQEHLHQARQAQQVQQVQQVQQHAYRVDGQNVHDHAVTQAIAKNIDMMSKEDNNDSQAKQAADAKQLINKINTMDAISDEEKSKSIRVIQSLTDSIHSRFQHSERQVLSRVMKSIQDEKDQKVRQDLYEMLAKQMASAVEKGSVVCSSGKIARMTGTFDGIKENVEPTRPMWAIRDEIANLAHKTQEANRSPEQFMSEARKIYVQDLGMSAGIIEPVLQEFAAHIDTTLP